MKGEVRKRAEREVGSVNRMMSIGRFLENKGRMLQGEGNQLYENCTLQEECFMRTGHWEKG